jgi:hypothetical protein
MIDRQGEAMTIHPKLPKDLMLAPVAAEIDANLQRIREKSLADIEWQLELELDQPANRVRREDRARLVLRQALRDVEMHGWTAAITDDASRLHLDGGSVSIDLGLGPMVSAYIGG